MYDIYYFQRKHNIYTSFKYTLMNHTHKHAHTHTHARKHTNTLKCTHILTFINKNCTNGFTHFTSPYFVPPYFAPHFLHPHTLCPAFVAPILCTPPHTLRLHTLRPNTLPPPPPTLCASTFFGLIICAQHSTPPYFAPQHYTIPINYIYMFMYTYL